VLSSSKGEDEMKCVCCDNEAKFSDNTAVGVRHFCTEKCWAEYNGLEVKPEGHYGLIKKEVGWWA